MPHGVEIERKFLVVSDSYKSMAYASLVICQGYLNRDPQRTVRIRTIEQSDNRKAVLTVKGPTEGCSRMEYEYTVPYEDAIRMLSICDGAVISKRRWLVDWKGCQWEVDEFLDALSPLVVAEIELSSPDESFSLPPFAGQEVTGDPAYYNSTLAAR